MKGVLYGVAINDSETPVRKTVQINGKAVEVWGCPFYKIWCLMLARCYSKAYKKSYKYDYSPKVCEEWLIFSNFKTWMDTQDWIGKQLDKDILVPGNKEYSPTSCVFVTQELNKFFNLHGNRGRVGLFGAYPHCRGHRYVSQITIRGEKRILGHFDSELEAHLRWIEEKIVALQSHIQYADGTRLGYRLIEICNNLKESLKNKTPIYKLL
ncbi:TPA: hypothetical protein MA058_003527 [Klebsiella pneumoniae]|nr:hypothetical protein [Klebsiella pneumoniae]